MIASILRRTQADVHVKFFCRGFQPKSFEIDRLKVEFISGVDGGESDFGRYPSHVPAAVFDRLYVIRDHLEWDRCLIMDHDMSVFCDLEEYFKEDFEGNLLLGRLFGEGNTLGLQMHRRGGLPEVLSHCENYPYFFMGPMMNLTAMREEGTWEKLLYAHEHIGQDEQISLTAATEGRVKGVSKKWNLVPQWDNLEKVAAIVAAAGEERVTAGGITWYRGVPEGIVHWTGGPKPWQRGNKVWRADLWEGEMTNWEQLRLGLWKKPREIQVQPSTSTGMNAMARRGWRVTVHATPQPGRKNPRVDAHDLSFPDLNVVEASKARLRDELAKAGAAETLVRFGPGVRADEWLSEAENRTSHILLQGPVAAETIQGLEKLGYQGEARIKRHEWPAGGPDPQVLDFAPISSGLDTDYDEDLYLTVCQPTLAAAPQHSDRFTEEKFMTDLEEPLRLFLQSELASFAPAPDTIFEVGPGYGSRVLCEHHPEARIMVLDHSAVRLSRAQAALKGFPKARTFHRPLDRTLPWFDLRDMPLDHIDLFLVDGPHYPGGMRDGALSLQSYVKPGGLVVLNRTDFAKEKSASEKWRESGFESLHSGEGFEVLRRTPAPDLRIAETSAVQREPQAVTPSLGECIASFAEKVYVISLSSRSERRILLEKEWGSQGIVFECIEQELPAPDAVRWPEVSMMRLYGMVGQSRTNHAVQATAAKRGAIKALEAFLESGAETALICEDDCTWAENAADWMDRAISELPPDWELLYFLAEAQSPNLAWSPHLVKLTGAKLCTAVLWRRDTALKLLPGLRESGAEWDEFMAQQQAETLSFCMAPMPASRTVSAG
ncbi:hypothetical protein KBB96_03295 [Luteolibacter ambystomatis]|uniref:Uncharacterized protein n=1 Tax=Luteolibacter ambystomatis TaxID=2824561 RepID=A0A975J0S6_9BACT|nr:hypothetical protein [Luteolibacter ambystomatis]QUE51920.1 hypothetical protein KBB96_03295 [Luteolibacter ambystomatis]